MATRTIVQIDEEKCNGCGQCAIACAEGAIAIIDGKARLISETYCDGLGACLGECPQSAITLEQREAESFDEKAVEEHLARQAEQRPGALACGCPATVAHSLHTGQEQVADVYAGEPAPSQLSNWPVQIHLVPPTAPYLHGARLVIAADCTPFAFADFHRHFLTGKVLLIGCPKLDDALFYQAKLAQIFSSNGIKDIEVVYMEVPCCSGLVRIVREALKEAGVEIPVTLTKIGIQGDIKERTTLGGGTPVQEGVGARGGK
jgi:Pyruvate/2-oxoacid:ferredoxin oxidoreductase delta subunit